MFTRLPDGSATVAITLDGVACEACAGASVAAAMLAAGRLACRTTPVSDSPRGPFCMMGACFDCIVTIDGVPNRQGCAVRVVAGMRIDTQRGARTLDLAPSAS